MNTKNKLCIATCIFCSYLSTGLQAAPTLNINQIKSYETKQDIKRIVLLDGSIEQYDNLHYDISTAAKGKNVRIIEFNNSNSKQQPLDEISQLLSKYKQLDSIHLFSHGFSGGLKLGEQDIDEMMVANNSAAFNSWKNALAEEGQILLYGCNVSKGDRGQNFIEALAKITQAEVFASNNYSGKPQINQDWVLESSTGSSKYSPLISNSRKNKFTANLELINGNAFLHADNVIAGIGPDGAFGSNIPIQSGRFAGSKIGYMSDPSGQRFTGPYDGDFFLPGYPEEGWAINLRGTNYNNNSNKQTIDIDGGLSNFELTDRYSSVDWIGDINELEITKQYRTYNKGLAIVVDVELKNTSSLTMKDVFYMRTVDPDNNSENLETPTGVFATKNTIVSQGDKGTASVKATQADGSQVALTGYTRRARVSHGLERVRDPIAVYYGTNGLNSSGSATEDRSISLSIKFDEILPGEVAKFTFSYSLANLQPPSIVLDADNSSGLTGGDYKQLYELGATGVDIADEDVLITSNLATVYDGLKIKITNPSAGDLLTISKALPDGITLNPDDINDDIEINLIGTASPEKYIEAIHSILFSNDNLNANLTTRDIVIQILDDKLTLSNISEAHVFMTVPLVVDSPITADNTVNTTEVASGTTITGTTAPEASLVLTLTDIDGNTVIKNKSATDSGIWSITLSENEMNMLEDGLITIGAVSTDQNDYVTTGSSSFIKDTTVPITFTKPVDQAIVNASEVLIEGESDSDATVVVTSLDGRTCSTTVNSQGYWACEISGLEKGETYPITALATDSLNNMTSTTMSISVSDLPLNVTSPALASMANDETPHIFGTTEPFVEVTVTSEFGDECKATADANGNWNCHLPSLPIGGPHDLSLFALNPANGSEATLDWSVGIPDRPLVVDQPMNDDLISSLPAIVDGTSNPNTEVIVMGPNGEICTTLSDNDGNWSCKLVNILTGDQQEIKVTTIRTDGSTDQVIRLVNVIIVDGQVQTILEGGGGAAGPFFLTLLLLLVVRRRIIKK